MGNGASCGCCAADAAVTETARRTSGMANPPRQSHAAWQTGATNPQWQPSYRLSTRDAANTPAQAATWTVPATAPVERKKSDSSTDDGENRQTMPASTARQGFAPRTSSSGAGAGGSHPHIPPDDVATTSSTTSGEYEMPEEQAQGGTAAVATFELAYLTEQNSPCIAAATREQPHHAQQRQPPQLGGSAPHHFPSSNAVASRTGGYHWDDEDGHLDGHGTRTSSEAVRQLAQVRQGGVQQLPSSSVGGGPPSRVLPTAVHRRYSSSSSGNSSSVSDDDDDDGGPVEDVPCAKC